MPNRSLRASRVVVVKIRFMPDSLAELRALPRRVDDVDTIGPTPVLSVFLSIRSLSSLLQHLTPWFIHHGWRTHFIMEHLVPILFVYT